ncbi:MAG: hypothetical protein JSS29_11010 [Proteobacteria bacterium]|nr:hypothetical protein [Pseudomonadota bacterium]
MDKENDSQWLAVIGRSLAYLVLHNSAAGKGSSQEKAQLLNSLGVPRDEIAEMLGTTGNSIGNMLRRKKGRKRGKK